MARTPSQMISLGSPAADFSLPDVVTGLTVSRDAFAHRPALLVTFICVHCPYVKHVEKVLAALLNEYVDRQVGVVAINSNDASAYPDDGPDGMREQASRLGFRFPFCVDESQEVARAYGAACTPDFFLFDGERKLVYRGQLDASRPSLNVPVTGADLRHALDAVLTGRPISAQQVPSIGCGIKWKSAPLSR